MAVRKPNLQPAIHGALGGAGASIAQNYLGGALGGLAGPVGLAAAGYFTRNDTLMTLAGVQLGASLASGIGIGSGSPAVI